MFVAVPVDMTECRAGQLHPTEGPHNLQWTCMRAALLYTYIKSWGGVLNSVEGHYLQVAQKVPLNDKEVGFTKLKKTQRMIGLMCAALKVISIS